MTPGFAKPRHELPWLPYGECSRVIINAHNFTPAYLYPSLRTTPPVAGYYARLDAGSAATDQFTADGSQDGTLTNGATRANDSGLAYSFDGTNDLVLTSLSASSIGNTPTLSCWMKRTNANAFGAILSNRPGSFSTATDKTFALTQGDPFAGTANKRIGFILFDTISRYRSYVTNTDVIDGNFHHIAVVVGASSVTVYIDGVSRTTTLTSAGTWPAVSGGRGFLSIGAANDAATPLACLVDDAVVYSSNLSATDIGYLASQRGAIYATA